MYSNYSTSERCDLPAKHTCIPESTTVKSVHIHDDLKLGCDDFICTIMYSVMS